MSQEPTQAIEGINLDYARVVVISGVRLGQQLNDIVVASPLIRSWNNSMLLSGYVCCAGGLARMLDITRDDFLALCSAAFDLIHAEEKSP